MAVYKGQSGVEYTTECRLGAGGNGTVFYANYKDACGRNRKCAIKVFRGGKGNKQQNAERKERFKREISFLIENCSLKGVTELLDYDADFRWFAMPIYRRIGKETFCDAKEILAFFVEVGEIIKKIDVNGRVHRDIKPKNILFEISGGIKKPIIVDFGLLQTGESTLTKAGEKVGSLFFAAPECLYYKPSDNIAIGIEADVYSLAKTIWAVLKKVDYAFPGKYDRTSSYALSTNEQPFFQCECLEPLNKLLEKATEYDPKRRISLFELVMLLQDQISFLNETIDSAKKDHYLFEEAKRHLEIIGGPDVIVYQEELVLRRAFEKMAFPREATLQGERGETFKIIIQNNHMDRLVFSIADGVYKASTKQVEVSKQEFIAICQITQIDGHFINPYFSVGDTIRITLLEKGPA